MVVQKCLYCGRINSMEAMQCRGCGASSFSLVGTVIEDKPSTQKMGHGSLMIIETIKGTIVCRFATDAAANVKNTIDNFETKANSGFFNGLKFHRVEGWVIQGGDPLGNGTGGGKMPAEYNRLPFNEGALGVARGSDKSRNNDSQFFITKKDSGWLDGEYTNFGQVIEGLDVVKKIAVGDKITAVRVEERG